MELDLNFNLETWDDIELRCYNAAEGYREKEQLQSHLKNKILKQ